MVASQIAGWILFIIGILMYLIILIERIRKLFQPTKRADFDSIEDTVDAIRKLLEAFSKFSDDMQFLLLASGCLIAGIYLLKNTPF